MVAARARAAAARAGAGADPGTGAFFAAGGGGAWLLEELGRLPPGARAAVEQLPALGQAHVLREPREGWKAPRGRLAEALGALGAQLEQLERFYDSIGGLAGYQAQCERLAGGPEGDREGPGGGDDGGGSGPPVRFLVPSGLSLEDPAQASAASAAVRGGLAGLSRCAEVLPLGGAGDRLGLRCEQTGEPLPQALLPYCGRTLLEALVRDLQAREYLHFRTCGEQLTTPMAVMTSDAKGNHGRVEGLCREANWFHRGAGSFKLFRQPMVPVVRAGDARWLSPEPLQMLMKPGGHGVIWKLMLDEGVFDWLREDHGRDAAVLRQISNPLAGSDGTLLALAGQGMAADRAFGFASCERKVGASEGCNVLRETDLGPGRGFSYSISNVEYTEFERLGIQDQASASEGSEGDEEAGSSAFPANTNILFLGLGHIERLVREGAARGVDGAEVVLPGLILNLSKTMTYRDSETGREVSEKAGRLECTMQNLADSMGQLFPESLEGAPGGSPDSLETFLVYNARRKVTSSAKKQRKPGVVTEAGLRQTPDGSFLDLLRNGAEVLQEAGWDVPAVGSAASYLQEGPNVTFLFHPALGPVWSVISQKLRSGSLAPGAELVLEVAEADVEGLRLNGSLQVEAENVMGAVERPSPGTEPRLLYSDRVGRVRLLDVCVENAGVDYGCEDNCYWQRRMRRHETMSVKLHGHSEFEARSATFKGPHRFEVPDGFRLVVTQDASGSLREELTPLDGRPSWRWEYNMANERPVDLTLMDEH